VETFFEIPLVIDCAIYDQNLFKIIILYFIFIIIYFYINNNKKLTMKNFFRNLLMMPDRNGNRRLIKNIFTGKTVWTRGVEQKFVDLDEKSTPKSGIIFEEHFKSFEPIVSNRFKVNFPNVDPYYIFEYNYCGNDIYGEGDSYKSTISAYLPMALTIEQIFLDKLNKKIEDVTIELLDPTGEVNRTITLSNVTITQVNVFQNFSFHNNDLQTITVELSHSSRIIS
jgi:hypothetical protein